jgi:hypothetical protein
MHCRDGEEFEADQGSGQATLAAGPESVRERALYRSQRRFALQFPLPVALDMLLVLETLAGRQRRGFAQTLAMALAAIVFDHGGKALLLDLTGDQRLDESNIDTHTIGDAIGPDPMRMELRDHAQLGVAIKRARSRVAERRRWCAFVLFTCGAHRAVF